MYCSQPAAQDKSVVVHATLIYDCDGLEGPIHVETRNAFESAGAGLATKGCESHALLAERGITWYT